MANMSFLYGRWIRAVPTDLALEHSLINQKRGANTLSPSELHLKVSFLPLHGACSDSRLIPVEFFLFPILPIFHL